MFLAELEETEKQAFVELANRFMCSDGTKGDAEARMLEQMRSQMWPTSVPEEGSTAAIVAATVLGKSKWLMRSTFSDDTPIADLLSCFTSRASRSIALLEIIGLGHADANYCALEEEFVNEMATAFQIPLADVAAMENWVLRQLTLVNEARAIINGEAD